MASYTAVRPLQNPKVGIAFTLVLVFLVGAVVGALVEPVAGTCPPAELGCEPEPPPGRGLGPLIANWAIESGA